jgi:hypothetical protein
MSDKNSRIAEAIENAKPSNMEPEKKAKVLRNIKRTAVIAGTAIVAAVIVNTVKYYSNSENGTEAYVVTEED